MVATVASAWAAPGQEHLARVVVHLQKPPAAGSLRILPVTNQLEMWNIVPSNCSCHLPGCAYSFPLLVIAARECDTTDEN